MFDLPAAPRYLLRQAPLAQALAQVRFPIQAKLGTLDGLTGVQERLNERYPYLEPGSQGGAMSFQLGPEGAQAAIGQQQQYVFNSDDGHAVYVTPGMVTLSTGAGYQGAEDFTQRLGEILELLQDVVHVPRCDRIAARYLTLAATPPQDPKAWVRWFKPELVGWAGSDLIAPSTALATALNQVHLSSRPSGEFAAFPADVGGLVRHGLVPKGSGVDGIPPVQVEAESYVLDFDFFCEAPQPWHPPTLLNEFTALHGQIDRFFLWTLAEEGLRDFGYQELT